MGDITAVLRVIAEMRSGANSTIPQARVATRQMATLSAPLIRVLFRDNDRSMACIGAHPHASASFINMPSDCDWCGQFSRSCWRVGLSGHGYSRDTYRDLPATVAFSRDGAPAVSLLVGDECCIGRVLLMHVIVHFLRHSLDHANSQQLHTWDTASFIFKVCEEWKSVLAVVHHTNGKPSADAGLLFLERRSMKQATAPTRMPFDAMALSLVDDDATGDADRLRLEYICSSLPVDVAPVNVLNTDNSGPDEETSKYFDFKRKAQMADKRSKAEKRQLTKQEAYQVKRFNELKKSRDDARKARIEEVKRAADQRATDPRAMREELIQQEQRQRQINEDRKRHLAELEAKKATRKAVGDNNKKRADASPRARVVCTFCWVSRPASDKREWTLSRLQHAVPAQFSELQMAICPSCFTGRRTFHCKMCDQELPPLKFAIRGVPHRTHASVCDECDQKETVAQQLKIALTGASTG